MIRHFEIGYETEGAIGLVLGALPKDWWICSACQLVNRAITDEELWAYQSALDDAPGCCDKRCLRDAEARIFRPLHECVPLGICRCSRPSHRPPKPGGFWNYLLWGDGGLLLYVGMTRHPRSRFNHHRNRPGWGELICDVTWVECPDAAEMVADETSRIAWLQPPLNVVGV